MLENAGFAHFHEIFNFQNSELLDTKKPLISAKST